MLKHFPCLLLLSVSLSCPAEPIVLQDSSFEHIHFRRIQPTVIRFEQDTIIFDVNKSSSFLLLAFNEIKDIRTVSFEWKADGMLNKSSASQERTRKGDDAWLRVGLIISGEPDLIPEPLLPRWVIKARDALKHPSDRMLYLIPDARHPPGETWRSPFSQNIDMVSVESQDGPDGWKQVQHEFAQPQPAVGLWLMADGDNTGSIFNSRLRKLSIE